MLVAAYFKDSYFAVALGSTCKCMPLDAEYLLDFGSARHLLPPPHCAHLNILTMMNIAEALTAQKSTIERILAAASDPGLSLDISQHGKVVYKAYSGYRDL